MPDDESINGTEDRLPRRAELRRTLRQVRKSLVHGGLSTGLRRNERRAIATSIVHTSELYPKRELT